MTNKANKPNNGENKPNKSKATTIKIYGETKSRLDKLKEHSKESYDEVLRKIFFIFNSLRKDSEKAQRVLKKIDRGAKRRKVY
ncbi:hypothetical protein CMI42_03605 [Candidatus Pacearchaeota archaeon]|nr:hypothetical protein [Candidatus Pacearchaeota archaeon]|tara:strand:+ start:351 stop:599 length:249 start_codon:yes stop_codon:yes gene_type:complete